jgi:hypothetical protein
MKKAYYLKFMAVTFMVGQILLSMPFVSCSDNDDTPTSEEIDKTEIFIERLTSLLDNMTSLRDGAVFGEKEGQYPVGSKKMLDDQILSLNETIAKLRDGTKKLSNSDMDYIISETNKIESKFRKSIRTEDFLPVPAELHVNGKNGGYIDFGAHSEYSAFTSGFTVDLWLKFEAIGSFDYILSTFIDNQNAADRYRQGWCVNYYGEGGAKNLRMTYSLDKDGLYEPWIRFEDVGRWIHFAAVWNPVNVSDGSGNPRTFKMYLDGQLVKEENWGQTNYTPNTQGASMIGCNYTNYDGSIATDGKGTNGWMKHVHIWNTVKTQSEIQNIMNNPESVTGTETDLVCGWDLSKTVSEDNDIKDLTGQFSARLIGDYRWVKY